MKIIFYAVNGLGLGHITRLLAVAMALKKINPLVSPIFLTSSEASFILYKHGMPYIKLPSKNTCLENGFSMSELAMIYQQTITNLVNTCRPDCLVVDTFPLGSLDELVFVLNSCDIKKVFIHRERRFTTKAQIMYQKFYDLVIAPHIKGEVDIPVPDDSRLIWSGNIMIRERKDLLPKEEVRRRLNLPEGKKIVYLTNGGGGDGTTSKLYEKVIAALAHRKDLHLVIAKAPLCKDEIRANGNSMIIDYYPAMELMNGFDAAVSAAGYNTFNELMFCKVPTVFIPKPRAQDNQEKRANVAARRFAGFRLDESSVSTKLERCLDIVLEHRDIFSKHCQSFNQINGASVAAHAILDVVGKPEK